MKKRVLLVENAAEFVGGGQVSFLGLIHGLDRDRFEPIIACPSAGGFLDAVVDQGLPAFVLPMPSLRGLGVLRAPFAILAWLRFLRDVRVDLIHANGTRAMMYAGLAGRLCGVPVVWHVRVLGTDGFVDDALSRMATRVVVNSEAVARRFHEDADRAAGAVTVIHNGVDLNAFAAAKPDSKLREQWRLSNKLVLAVVAQLIPWKRHAIAIETLALLRRRGLDAALVLLGDEVPASRGYRAELEAHAAALGVAEHCVFAGFRQDIPAVLKLADLLIHPAKDEPFGRALIEAMASGLPVVAAGGGGVGEIVEDGVTGRVVRLASADDWADVVEELLRDAKLRRRMGRDGRRRAAERFSVQAHVSRVHDVYEEAVSAAR